MRRPMPRGTLLHRALQVPDGLPGSVAKDERVSRQRVGHRKKEADLLSLDVPPGFVEQRHRPGPIALVNAELANTGERGDRGEGKGLLFGDSQGFLAAKSRLRELAALRQRSDQVRS